MNSSLSDKSKFDDSKDSKEKNVSFMTFPTTLESIDGTSDGDPSVLADSCVEDSQDDSVCGLNLLEAYKKLFKECEKQKKLNKKLLKILES